MLKLGVFTSARSDYGLLRALIVHLQMFFDVDLLVSGAHFSGREPTFQEILGDRIIPERQIVRLPAFLDSHRPASLGKSVGLLQIAFSQVLEERAYDGLVILGDRFELFGVSVPAMLCGMPLFHISGGEVTEGVIDDGVRHAHTKLAHVHLAATDAYAANISSMGEEDWRIVVSGECGLDEMQRFEPVSDDEIREGFGIDLTQRVLLICYHPETLAVNRRVEDQMQPLLDALRAFPQEQKVFSAPGFEKGAEVIPEMIQKFCRQNPRCTFVQNLGRTRYLTVLRRSAVVVGNSSSGLVEAPSFGVPTVNIGDRQKNRTQAASVLQVPLEKSFIQDAIAKALTTSFADFCRQVVNPYDPHRDGRNSARITYALQQALETVPREKLLKKRFINSINRAEWNTLLKGFGRLP